MSWAASEHVSDFVGHRDTDPVDIGDGHKVIFRYAILRRSKIVDGHQIELEPSEVLSGLRDNHGCSISYGWIPFANAEPPFDEREVGWTVDNWDLDHFTLSPSVQCTNCGDHGYIRDGRWVPA